jgi:hypothetical protein
MWAEAELAAGRPQFTVDARQQDLEPVAHAGETRIIKRHTKCIDTNIKMPIGTWSMLLCRRSCRLEAIVADRNRPQKHVERRIVVRSADGVGTLAIMRQVEPGAERLVGQGHLAAKLSGEGKIILAQAPFADKEETLELADIVASASRKICEQA